jgi:glycosyltransferase involved in cell wall biosynthesis
MVRQLEITSSVIFLGWRDDVDRLIPLLDAVLLPSSYEGFPLIGVQAATAHVPVVGFAVGGLPELVPPNFLAPPADEDGLVAVLTGLLQGTARWPAQETARRAADWSDPAAAAAHLVRLLETSSAIIDLP